MYLINKPCTKVAGKCYEKTNCRFCRSMNFHIISLRKIKIRRGHWWITFLNVHFFLQRRSGAGWGTRHWRGWRRRWGGGVLSQHSYSTANTVLLSFLQIKCFHRHPFFTVAASYDLYLLSNKVSRGWDRSGEECCVGAFIGPKIAGVFVARANKALPQYQLTLTPFHIKRKYSGWRATSKFEEVKWRSFSWLWNIVLKNIFIEGRICSFCSKFLLRKKTI